MIRLDSPIPDYVSLRWSSVGATVLLLLTLVLTPSGAAPFPGGYSSSTVGPSSIAPDLLSHQGDPLHSVPTRGDSPTPDRTRPTGNSAYWSNISGLGTTAPGETLGGAMAFDPAANTTVFIGYDGYTQSYDSWTYNNFTWSPPSPGVGDTFSAEAYDPSDSELIEFGGLAPIASNPGGGATLPTAATYAFTSGSWVNLTSSLSLSPPAAGSPLMATDPALDGALLLDPVGSTNGSQTWSFSNGTWTNLTSTAGVPPPDPSDADSVMAYDPVVSSVVFFGGAFPGPGYAEATNETWEFQGGRWTQLKIPSPDFSTGAVQAMAFDGAADALVDLVAPVALYSENGTPCYEDWEFIEGNWSNLTSHLPATPPIGYDPLSVWDPADGYLLYMSGGYDDQTWTLGSTPLHAQLSISAPLVDVGGNVTLSVQVTGGAPPYRYNYSGLPRGCLSASVPLLNCYPNSAGNFTIGASVEDFLNATLNLSVTLEVGPGLVAFGPLFTQSTVYVGTPVTFNVNASGGIPPYTFQWFVPPASCTPPNDPRFTCTVSQLGTFQIDVGVSDQTAPWSGGRNGTAFAWDNLTVVALPVITSFTAVPDLIEVGGSFELNSSVAGGAAPLSYNYTDLPLGCRGASAPSLSCRPVGSGTFNVTVTVTDGLGTSVRTSLELTVLPSVTIASEVVSPNPATIGSYVTFSYTLTGGKGPFHSTWSDLPPGCVPTQSTFACTIDTNGSYVVGLTVRDALGGLAYSNITLLVPAASGPVRSSTGLSAVPFWAWVAVGLGVIVVVGLVLWDRSRRRRASALDPGPTSEWNEWFPAMDGSGSSGSDPGVEPPMDESDS
jgi:hypothetical protein